MLLGQVDVEDAHLLRVVEIVNDKPNYTYLCKSLDYDAVSDVFVVGSQVLVNPFPTLQKYATSVVAPLHGAREHTRWEQKHWDMIHPHPKAYAFETLAAAGGVPVALPCLARFIRVDGKDLQIITTTQRSTLTLHWRRAYRAFPGPLPRKKAYGLSCRYVPLDSYHWLPGLNVDERLAFLSLWELPSSFSQDPASFVANARVAVVVAKPYDLWSRQCEHREMSRADVNVSLHTKQNECESDFEWWERRFRSKPTEHVSDQPYFEESEAVSDGSEDLLRREREAMENECVDVRYDSVWFREGLCWLCLRHYADSSDEEQTIETMSRHCTGPWNRPRYWAGRRKPACECRLCVDCWFSKARDSSCPLCKADITSWRLTEFFLRPNGFHGRSKRRRLRRLEAK